MPNQDNIEQETYISALHLPKIISVLKSFDKKGCTKAWLIAQTGLSMFQVEDALRELMSKYFCKLLVDEKTGELLYYFDLQQLVNQVSLLEKIRSYVVFILEFFFKLWISLMLFTFGLFYGAIVALILTGISQNPQVILFFIVGYFSAVYELLLSIGQYFSGEKNRQRFSEKNLLHLVFTYVFGPTVKNDPYRTEKIILGYLATHQYKITKTELLMLTGWQAQKIEKEIQQLIINYRGEPTVSEEGVIVYNFPEINITQEELLENSDASNKSYWVWDRKLELQKLGIGEASMVIAVVMFIGSIFSLAYTVFADPTLAQFWRFSYVSYIPIHDDFYISFWTSYFSLAFCLFFYILHFYYKWLGERRNYRMEMSYRRSLLLGQIFANLEGLKDDYIPKREKAIFNHLRLDLAGMPDVNQIGEKINRFDNLKSELEAIARIRGTAYQAPTPPVKLKPHRIETSRSSIVYAIILALFTGIFGGLLIWENFLKDYYLEFTASKQSIELKEKFQHPEKIEQLILDYPDRDKYYAKVVERNIGKCINLKKLTIIGAGSLPETLENCQELEFLQLIKVYGKQSDFYFLSELKKLKILISENSGQVLQYNPPALKVIIVNDASDLDLKSNTGPYSFLNYMFENMDSVTINNLNLRTFDPSNLTKKNWKYLNMTNLSYELNYDREVKMDSLKVLILNGMKTNEQQIMAFNWNWVTNFENLEELHCRDCKTVAQLPKDIAKLQNLRYLDIAGTKITVEDVIGELKSLEVLVVDEDLLKFYEQNFRHLLPKLKIKTP